MGRSKAFSGVCGIEGDRRHEGHGRGTVSAIPLQDAAERVSTPERSAKLPPKALAYFLCVAAAAVGVTAPFLADLDRHTGNWFEFAVLAVCVAVAQFFVVRTPGNKSYHTTGVFLIAAALLVPPGLVAMIPLIQHIPEWLRSRGTWYVQMTNIFVFTIATMSAWGAAHVLVGADALVPNDDIRFALAGTAASIVLVVLNSALIAPMIRLVNGHPMRQMFSYQTLSTEFVFAALGVVLAAFWMGNPWLVPFAIAPLLLIHRALSVPQLQAEARVDPKTGLFNARYFASALSEELSRAQRFERPLSLIMADLDLLREINNTYGHLAGDAVLKGIAEVFRAELRHYDVPARFGGEEFSILLPETPPEQALEIAERIRRAVAEKLYDVETSSEPIRATVSIGVAGFPKDAQDPNALIHQADLAVYRAKLQGRNRVLGASSEPLLMPSDRTQRLVAVPEEGDHREPLARVPEALPEQERRHTAHTTTGPRFLQLSTRLGALVGLVTFMGVAAGVVGAIFGSTTDVIGIIAVIALVGLGEALSLELDDGSISVSAVGSLAGAALFGWRAALALAITTAVVQWSARRPAIHQVLFNIGALSLSSLAAAAFFGLGFDGGLGELVTVAVGLVAGAAYFAVNTGLISLALAFEGRERWWRVWHERFIWLAPHYLVYGFIGGVIAIGYHAAGLYALAVFAVPLLLMRKTQEAYLSHTRRSAQKLRQAAETIHTQNVSLEQANRLLKERSTAAMESLSATVDARDAYTAGHSRRVQQLALAIGRELGLSQVELDLLGHAALFHDIGKLAIPDSILLKPASLTEEEWALMQRHADEGARIIDRLGFLGDAVPAIRHHHERFDGTGYPDRLRHEEIPLGARIIHVADALDSMLTTRIYRAARPLEEALSELRSAAGTQFCPRCVAALERILPLESVKTDAPERPKLLAI
jgi:diguanylate cyclase (GGDEF)-like protein/putative nucleotidyltransferase with HDIG domain